VLGIAVLLSALAAADDLGTFRAGWLVMTATALLTAACGIAVGRTRAPAPTTPAPRPVVAEERA
jgi:hypothetical protein